jgi:dTMP kinase
MSGLFITFEGPDGSGKSTQVHHLAHYLEENQIPYIHTREPGGTEISDQIRALILNPLFTAMKNETEILLYAASRAQHVREKILPALESGKVVLCDRFVDASIAYQGYGLGTDVETVVSINEFAAGGLKPDRSYFIDLPPDIGRERMLHRYEGEALDRIEQKDLNYHETVREGFHEIYRKNIDRICFLDGSKEINHIFSSIKEDFDLLWHNYNKNENKC